jgi:hypothetical protein
VGRTHLPGSPLPRLSPAGLCLLLSLYPPAWGPYFRFFLLCFRGGFCRSLSSQIC